MLLKPIILAVTLCADACGGSALGEFARWRGRVTGQCRQGGEVAIEAAFPLMAAFGHLSGLRSMSAGRASASMLPRGYAKAPRDVRDAVKQQA